MSDTTTSSPHSSTGFFASPTQSILESPIPSHQFARHARRLSLSLSNTIQPPDPSQPLVSRPDIFKLLPIPRHRAPSIPTKLSYPVYLNPINIHDYSDPIQNPHNQPAPHYVQSTSPSLHHPTTALTTDDPRSIYPFSNKTFTKSAYGPGLFKVQTIDAFPNADHNLNTTPAWWGKMYSSVIIAGISALTKVGLIGNKIYIDNNNNYLAKLIDFNAGKRNTTQIPGLLYPHSDSPTITEISQSVDVQDDKPEAGSPTHSDHSQETRNDPISNSSTPTWTFSHSPNFSIPTPQPTTATFPTTPNKSPIITFSNHNSTIDDPFILVAIQPHLNYQNTRWEICGQDICYPSDFIGSGFMSGRVLPIQRGSGLHQPHFTRLHNLLSNGEWVHLFPEGKVQFTPRWDGYIEHDRRDPPKELLPFKWGIGALVAESLLRGEDLTVVPIVHSTARVHPKSAGIPDFGQEASILVGNNVVSQVKPIVDDYMKHVIAYEEGKVSFEPQKELLFGQISEKLKHVMDSLYSNVERHPNIPQSSSLYQPLTSFSQRDDRNSTSSQPPCPRTRLSSDELRNPCKYHECWCTQDEGYPQRERRRKHDLFASTLFTDVSSITSSIAASHNPSNTTAQARIEPSSFRGPIQPWFAQHPWFDLVDLSTRSQSALPPKFDEDSISPALVTDYLAQFNHHIQNSGIPPDRPANTPDLAPQSQSPLFSHHSMPRLFKVKTKEYQQKLRNEAQQQYDLSHRIETQFIPRNEWGTGKYSLGLDKFDPMIKPTEVNNHDGSVQSHPQSHKIHASVRHEENLKELGIDKTGQTQYTATWYTLWSHYNNNNVMTDYFEYHRGENGLVVDEKVFEKTWSDYINLSYSKLAANLQSRYYPDRLILSDDPLEYKAKLTELKNLQPQNPELIEKFHDQLRELKQYWQYRTMTSAHKNRLALWIATRDAQLREKQIELDAQRAEVDAQNNGKLFTKNEVPLVATEDMLDQDFLTSRPPPLTITPPTLHSQRGYPIDPMDNKSLLRDREYLAEVIMLRNRMEFYRTTEGFDWNGV